VCAGAYRRVALGGGATSRVDAIHNAREKAGRVGNDLSGCILASDAFFPFADGLEAAVDAGARAVIQPGGSVRDKDVVEAADRMSVEMLFTGTRHFRH
jgi:phosphoribosylaminoimidazolecarboxamide formyltransferase/IMP cyclohydrolase